ncbi:ATP-binding protein [Patescibacteria group bacterium]|nr:ATP-binding protein [Patescibacteria group bacterium]
MQNINLKSGLTLITGKTGSGKSYLIKKFVKSLDKNKVGYFSSQDFIEKYSEFIRQNRTDTFPEYLTENYNCLITDNLESLVWGWRKSETIGYITEIVVKEYKKQNKHIIIATIPFSLQYELLTSIADEIIEIKK